MPEFYDIALSMPYVLAVVSLVVLIGAPAYRVTASVVLAISMFNIALMEVLVFIGERQHNGGSDNPYLYVTFATLDSLTAFFLIAITKILSFFNISQYSKRTYAMALVISAAILINTMLIAEMLTEEGFVHNYYMELIFMVGCAQVILFIGGIYESVIRLREYIGTLDNNRDFSFNNFVHYRSGAFPSVLGQRK